MNKQVILTQAAQEDIERLKAFINSSTDSDQNKDKRIVRLEIAIQDALDDIGRLQKINQIIDDNSQLRRKVVDLGYLIFYIEYDEFIRITRIRSQRENN